MANIGNAKGPQETGSVQGRGEEVRKSIDQTAAVTGIDDHSAVVFSINDLALL